MIPILKKDSATQELINLCWLLQEAKNICDDSNLRWQLAQLENEAEELFEKFAGDISPSPAEPSKYYNEILVKLSDKERIETLLSFAFQSSSILNAARYEEIDPGDDFKNKIKSITAKTLRLLHEKKGYYDEDE